MHQNYFIYSPILISAFTLGLFILSKDFRSKKNRSLASLILSLTVWVFCLLITDTAQDISVALFWARMAIIGPGFIPALFLYFCLNFTNDAKVNKWYMPLIYLPAAVFTFLSPTALNVKSVRIHTWGSEVIPGILYLFLFLYFIIYFSFAFYNLFKSYKAANSSHRNQIKYIFLGAIIAVIFGLITNLILVQLGISQFSILGPFSTLLFYAFTAYAITKHELMDIRVAITRTAAYGIVGILLIASFVALNAFKMPVPMAMSANAALALFWSWATHRLRAFIQTPLEEKWITGWYDPTKVLINIAEKLVPILEREEVFKIIAEKLKNTIKIKKIDILIGKGYPPIGGVNRAEKIVEIPFKSSEGLEGALRLGEKISEDPYDEKDLRLFRTLQAQILAVLDRIRPYEKIKQDFEANQQKLHEAEVQLERSQRLSSLGRIIAEVSHEIRNPLTIISSRAREITDTAEDTGFVRESASLISERCEQIEKVIGTMHTLSQPPHHQPQKIDVKEPIASALRFMPFRKEIKIIKEYNPVPPIMGDKNELERVFINLFNNAYDAMSEKGGELHVRLQREDVLVKVEIEDTGVGISKEDLPKIFEPFYTTKFGKIKDRMGFGLSICHDIIVNKHRGTITAESTPGKGTKFTIILPALS